MCKVVSCTCTKSLPHRVTVGGLSVLQLLVVIVSVPVQVRRRQPKQRATVEINIKIQVLPWQNLVWWAQFMLHHSFRTGKRHSLLLHAAVRVISCDLIVARGQKRHTLLYYSA